MTYLSCFRRGTSRVFICLVVSSEPVFYLDVKVAVLLCHFNLMQPGAGTPKLYVAFSEKFSKNRQFPVEDENDTAKLPKKQKRPFLTLFSP